MLENAPVAPVPGSQRGLLGLEHGKMSKSSHALDTGGGGGGVVIMARIASLDRFQAQLKWEMSVETNSCSESVIGEAVDASG